MRSRLRSPPWVGNKNDTHSHGVLVCFLACASGWRAELEAESIIRDRLDRSLAHLEESCQRVLALPSTSPAASVAPSTGSADGAPLQHQQDMVMHHMNWRLEQFLARNENAHLWKAFRGSVTMNAFNALGRGHLGTQVAACCVDEVPWLICCVRSCIRVPCRVDWRIAYCLFAARWFLAGLCCDGSSRRLSERSKGSLVALECDR